MLFSGLKPNPVIGGYPTNYSISVCSIANSKLNSLIIYITFFFSINLGVLLLGNTEPLTIHGVLRDVFTSTPPTAAIPNVGLSSPARAADELGYTYPAQTVRMKIVFQKHEHVNTAFAASLFPSELCFNMQRKLVPRSNSSRQVCDYFTSVTLCKRKTSIIYNLKFIIL